MFNYNTYIREDWFQLMYILTNVNYKKLGYKSFTDFVYKKSLLKEDNRKYLIEKLTLNIKPELDNYIVEKNKDNTSTTPTSASKDNKYFVSLQNNL